MSEVGVLPGFEGLVAEEEGISAEEAGRRSAVARGRFEGMIGLEGGSREGGSRTAPTEGVNLDPLRAGFFDCLARGWDWRKALYIAWARLPRELRWPRSVEGLAEVMGLSSARSIRQWRSRNPEIEHEVRRAVLGTVSERTADVLAAALEAALGEGYRGYNDRRMLLEMAGVYREKSDVLVTATGPVNADEMAARREQVRRALVDWEEGRFGEGQIANDKCQMTNPQEASDPESAREEQGGGGAEEQGDEAGEDG